MSRHFPQLLSSLDVSTSTQPPRMTSPGEPPSVSIFADKPEKPSGPVLLTIPEVAATLRVSEKTVRRRIKDGTIPIARIGGRLLRIPADQLVRLAAGEADQQP